MYESSCWLSLPLGVLITRWIRPSEISSLKFGRPSSIFRTVSLGIPAAARQRWVPSVALIENPSSVNRRATSTTAGLSRSATLIRTQPSDGSRDWAACWAL